MPHRLLIVEDDAATRAALGRIFARRGWAVAAAATVAEGLALLEAGPEPCCVILDLMLPDGPGEAVLDQIRRAGLRSRVVVASAVSDAGRLGALAALGPDLIVGKPIPLDRAWEGACPVCGED